MKWIKYLIALIACINFGYSQWKPGDVLVDDRDGQQYKTVKIGNQVWMAENLNYGVMVNSQTGTPGHVMKNNQIPEKYCWENDTCNCNGTDGKWKRGAFYEWQEMMQFWDGQPTLPNRGLCPKGWHIPSNSEWNELFGVTAVSTSCPQLLKDGSSGFEALLTGYRCTQNGGFRPSAMTADTRTYFWTAEQVDMNNAPVLELGQNSITSFAYLKSLGLCVRCIWDGPTSDINDNIESNGLLEIKVLPNPLITNGKIVYKLHGVEPQNLQISIIDILGNLRNQKDIFITPGEYNLDINDMNLNSGTYIVIIKSARGIVENKFSILN